MNKDNSLLVSICIPSYNRPNTLKILLESIDINCKNDFEIVICEDYSPQREIINKIVNEYCINYKVRVKYFENENNLGYDKNLKRLINKANGEFIIFMGDDDIFIKENLKDYFEFLKTNKHLGYILRAYQKLYPSGDLEIFRYYDRDMFFEPGYETYVRLFRKAIFISGFTIKREFVLPYLVDIFDGTLLFQLYLLAEITLKYPSGFCNVFLTREIPKNTIPFFGSSEAESKYFSPGEPTISNSINFIKGFFKISKYIDLKYNLTSTKYIRKDISKYSFRLLSVQRGKGIIHFLNYIYLLIRDLQLNKTIYFYLYAILLLLFNVDNCDRLLIFIKNRLGKIPEL